MLAMFLAILRRQFVAYLSSILNSNYQDPIRLVSTGSLRRMRRMLLRLYRGQRHIREHRDSGHSSEFRFLSGAQDVRSAFPSARDTQ